MNRRPILRGRISAGVVVSLVFLLCSVPMWAQSQSAPDITKADPSDPLGVTAKPDWDLVHDEEAKPETRVLSADHAPGDVHGVVRYPGGLPMAGAQVFILNADVDVERSTVSAADGTYVFKHLKPGKYQIGAKLDGFAPSHALTVDVIPGKEVTFDVAVGSRQAKALPAASAASAYRSYSSTYRAEPASLRLGSSTDAEPTGETSSAPTVVDSPKTAEAAPAASQPIPAAVADELAAMRKRIDELEAELKGRSAVDQPPAATPATAAVAPPQGAAPAPAAAPETPKPGPG